MSVKLLRRKFECSGRIRAWRDVIPESRFSHNRDTPPCLPIDVESRFTAEHKLGGQFVPNCIKAHRAHVFYPQTQIYISLSRRLKQIPSERVTALSANFFRKKWKIARRITISVERIFETIWESGPVSRTLFTTCRVTDEWPIRCENRCTQMTAGTHRIVARSISDRAWVTRAEFALAGSAHPRKR